MQYDKHAMLKDALNHRDAKEWTEFAHDRQIVNAIRALRNMLGMGLKEAKDVVGLYIDRHVKASSGMLKDFNVISVDRDGTVVAYREKENGTVEMVEVRSDIYANMPEMIRAYASRNSDPFG